MIVADNDIYWERFDTLTSSGTQNWDTSPSETSGRIILLNRDATVMKFESILNTTRSWYEDIHLRHLIRISIAFILLLIGILFVILSIIGLGFMDWLSAIVWIIGSMGLLGTATYMAIDANGE